MVLSAGIIDDTGGDAPLVPEDGLRSYHRLTPTDGGTDSSGNGNDLPVNGVTFAEAGAVFDPGEPDHLGPLDYGDGPMELTVSFWGGFSHYPLFDFSSDRRNAVARVSGANSGRAAGDPITFERADPNVDGNGIPPSPNHLVFKYGGGEWEFKVNDEVFDTGTYSALSGAGARYLVVGALTGAAGQDPNTFYQGAIRDFAVYGRKTTGAEDTALNEYIHR